MVRIEPATPETAPNAARVLALAFAADPFMAAVVPLYARHRLVRLRDLFAFQIASAGLATTDVAIHEGRVVGAAVWFAPGRPTMPWRHPRVVCRAVRAARGRGLVEIARFEREVKPLRPTEPHWHLEDIGAAPQVRELHLGIGKALLRHRLTIIDEAGLPAFLEATTPTSRRLYERYGFQARGLLRSAGGTTTAMVRPPSDRAS